MTTRLPLPSARINRIMTIDRRWGAVGMGAHAETYLAGPDGLMRSDSRVFLEDPERYRDKAIAAGGPEFERTSTGFARWALP